MQPESTSTDTRRTQRSNSARSRGSAARFAHRREEHLFLEAAVVLADDGDLQLFARAEVGEHARLAHLRHVGQRPDGQAFQAHLRGQAQGGIEDGGARLQAFLQGLGGACFRRRAVRRDSGHGGLDEVAMKTNDRSILQTSVSAW